MAKGNIKKKTPVNKTISAEPGKTTTSNPNYTGYFYNQIDRLWQEVMLLQAENIQLKAEIKGEY